MTDIDDATAYTLVSTKLCRRRRIYGISELSLGTVNWAGERRERNIVHIERMQVEGGFLDGLNVEFASGLNVIIGARGTGKTSIIELLRFALGARNHTVDAEKRSIAHATATLGGGEVTVTLGDLIEDVVVSRAIADEAPRAQSPFTVPLVLSQTEIETLGLSDAGRLRLLDSFVDGRAALRAQEAAAISSVRSAFKEISALEDELAAASAGIEQLPVALSQVIDLEAQEKTFQATSADMLSKQNALNALGTQSAAIAVSDEMLDRFGGTVETWVEDLNALLTEDYGLEGWDGDPALDPLASFRQRYGQQIATIRKVVLDFEQLKAEAESKREPLHKSRGELDGQARELRLEVGKIAEGAAVVSRQLGVARTTVAQLQARQKVLHDRTARLNLLREKRDEKLVELEKVRKQRFLRRKKAAEEISEALAPQIRVQVSPLGQFNEYAKSLTEVLRGSGMKYNDLATVVSERVSPRELVAFLDTNDFIGFAEAAELPKDRAARLLGHLRDVGAAEVVTSNIEDDVKMLLLDGVEYKPIETLSAGQRCTVVLAMVLQHSRRILIIDQPEDHLDNAYIATTVVKALQSRKSQTQIILSTHNANIPVLGGAELVVELSSDGRHGYVQVCKPLEHSDAVEAITNVMEGGLEAFQRRAGFYDDHSL